VISKTVIGVVGMPGSGKSVVSDLARDLGLPVVVMGDVVREEVNRRGLLLTPENVGEVMLEIRTNFGDVVVAERCLPRIEGYDSSVVLIEGIRSWKEVDFLKEKCPKFQLVAVHSSPETRLKRLRRRMRSDDSHDRDLFDERDRRELKVGIGSAMAIADHLFVNEGRLETFKDEVKAFLLGVISSARSRG
jgi:dephospho-CoA kinase